MDLKKELESTGEFISSPLCSFMILLFPPWANGEVAIILKMAVSH
jgi:hypothetical protein